ncbi:acetolactate synthase small subunit, partial [Candidatus Micrarchaeota archaeon]|nr:acetolactate synthase small subunit [Candidatus Micrarchaeota archaeon]
KLIDVIKVSRLDENNCIERETALVKVFVKDFNAKSEVLSYAQAFDAKIVDVAPKTLVAQVTGESRKIDSFVELLKPFGLRQVARTGACAMERE